MNSFILTSLAAFFKAFGAAFKESGICKLLLWIYNSFSKGWQNSRIMNWIGSTAKNSYAKDSVIYKFFKLPVVFWEFLQKKFGTAINQKIKTSFICALGRSYIHNFMAVNTRFWGTLLLSSCLGYTLIKLVTVHSYSKLVLCVGAVGAIALIFKFNLMAFLNGSKVVDFVKAAIGFKHLDFEFYNEDELCGPARIVLAALVGLLTGAVMVFMPLYGLAVPFAVFGLLLVMYAPITGVYAAMFAAPIVPTMILAGLCLWTGLSFLIKAISTPGFRIRIDGVGF